MLARIIDRLFKPSTIRGADGSPYLTRYRLIDLGKEIGRLYIHRFHRGDEDPELHDHPWHGISLILAGGYIEERVVYDFDGDGGRSIRVRRFGPGSLNVILPTTFHRVDLIGKSAWTLFATGPIVKSWGFASRDGQVFTHWKTFVAAKGPLKGKTRGAPGPVDKFLAEGGSLEAVPASVIEAELRHQEQGGRASVAATQFFTRNGGS